MPPAVRLLCADVRCGSAQMRVISHSIHCMDSQRSTGQHGKAVAVSTPHWMLHCLSGAAPTWTYTQSVQQLPCLTNACAPYHSKQTCARCVCGHHACLHVFACHSSPPVLRCVSAEGLHAYTCMLTTVSHRHSQTRRVPPHPLPLVGPWFLADIAAGTPECRGRWGPTMSSRTWMDPHL